jgi:hypothetical protein
MRQEIEEIDVVISFGGAMYAPEDRRDRCGELVISNVVRCMHREIEEIDVVISKAQFDVPVERTLGISYPVSTLYIVGSGA